MSVQSKAKQHSNVVSLAQARKLKKASEHDPNYEDKIASMSKVELLEEMVRFQEERSSRGHLTVGMMVRGKVLFAALHNNAETEELKLLSGSYRRHLEHELAAYIQQNDS